MEPKRKDQYVEMEEVESLCPECGHAFKIYMDRVLSKGGPKSELAETITCPVCGCNECAVVHKGSS